VTIVDCVDCRLAVECLVELCFLLPRGLMEIVYARGTSVICAAIGPVPGAKRVLLIC
jgi:hypothetical protein